MKRKINGRMNGDDLTHLLPGYANDTTDVGYIKLNENDGLTRRLIIRPTPVSSKIIQYKINKYHNYDGIQRCMLSNKNRFYLIS